MPQPPSLRSLATLTGFSLGTVSMALRDDPRIAPKTRELILRTATAQGYKPDPLLAGRMNHIRRRSATRAPVKLAHVVAWNHLGSYYEFGPFRDFKAGAAARAAEFGYEFEDFLLDDVFMHPQRLAGILRTRSVPGVLIAPVQRPEIIHARLAAGDPWLKLDFTAYATIGYTLNLPRISRTVHDHAAAVEMACLKLSSRGYRRIGLVLSEIMHTRVHRRWLAGWVCSQADLSKAPRPLIAGNLTDPAVFDRWLKREKPDVIITCDWDTVSAHLQRLRLGTPDDIGLVDLQWLSPDSARAAVDQSNHEVGAAAVDIILAQINRHERGEPAIPKTVLVPGRWIEGPSIRPAT
ncbi:LacI family DNA-binding transcriptional regulator [Rariglobus hedericola]|nr:LacI family DNA-binding transcriptional regulator [Rariglobus hedericola]